MQREVINQWRVESGIPEGDVFEFYRARELVVILVLADGHIGKVNILRVLHHILHALHLRPHLLEGLSRVYHRHGGTQEGGEKALKGRDHAEGELTAHAQPDSKYQDHRVCQSRDKRGNAAEILIEPRILRVLLVDGRLKAHPTLEVAVFRSAGLDGLYHADAGHGGRRQLAGVPRLYTGDIDALFRDDAAHGDIDEDAQKPHQRQQQTVAQHDGEIEDHHHDTERQWRQRVYQRFGNGRVGAVSGLNISRHALGKELHRHFENLPHEGAAADHRHLSVDFERVDRSDCRDKDLQQTHRRDERNKGHQKLAVFASQQPVHEKAGKGRTQERKHIADDTGQHDEGHRRTRARKPFAGEGQGACPFPVRYEVRCRRKRHDNAGERLIKLVHRDPDAAPSGIVDADVLTAETAEHHKVIEIPMDDTGESGEPFDSFHAHAEALGLKPIAPGGFHDVARLRAVSRYAAVYTHLLQRHPLSVIGKHHRKAGRAALQCLHLHDDGHFYSFAFSGRADVIFTHTHHRLS